MKKVISLFACLLFAASFVSAQSEDPKGLYRLQKLSYENGKPDHTPEFLQYKYCSSSPLTLMVTKATSYAYEYQLRIDEPHPYTFTGNNPVGEDGKGTRIFNSSNDHFCLKWYNTVRQGNEAIFPKNEFITEYYDKKNIEKQMARSIEMLEMRHEPANHRFAGCWSLIGNVGFIDGIETIVKPSFELYKIYGEKDMVILTSLGNVSYWPLCVNNEEQIIEGKNTCDITWRSDNTFILSFDRGDGIILKELWMRTGMPSLIQKLFGTNIPIKVIDVNPSF